MIDSGVPTSGEKVVVIHEDDVGMTHGANVAFVELVRRGTCSSGSVMVPCAWFPEAAEMAAKDADLDLGVHLTLTSEKKPYRWRPLTCPGPGAGLADEAGYFWPSVHDLRRHAVPEAVEAELRTQIDAAIAAGIDVTHLDAHMGAVMAPEFVDIYLRLAADYRLPLLLVRDIEDYGPKHNFGTIDSRYYSDVVARAQAQGFPIFEIALETPWKRQAAADVAYTSLFERIPLGLSFLSMHFNALDDFRWVEPEYAHIRLEEYELFRADFAARQIERLGLHVIGFRQIRDALRRHWDANPASNGGTGP